MSSPKNPGWVYCTDDPPPIDVNGCRNKQLGQGILAHTR